MSGQSATETTTLGSASAGYGLADNVGSVPLPHTSGSSAGDGGSPTWMAAYNERTSLYEIHKTGCTHLISKHLVSMGHEYLYETGAEALAEFERGNDGCYGKLGPCAKSKGG